MAIGLRKLRVRAWRDADLGTLTLPDTVCGAMLQGVLSQNYLCPVVTVMAGRTETVNRGRVGTLGCGRGGGWGLVCPARMLIACITLYYCTLGLIDLMPEYNVLTSSCSKVTPFESDRLFGAARFLFGCPRDHLARCHTDCGTCASVL